MIEKYSLTRADSKAEHKNQSNKETKMESEQTNTSKYITQAPDKAARAAIQAMPMAGTARVENMGPRISRPIMKHTTFDWSAKDKCAKLRNFKLEE